MSLIDSDTGTDCKAVCVCALYKFVELPDFEDLRPTFIQTLQKLNIRGTLLLAQEGLNGTIAGSHHSIEQFITWLEKDQRFTHIDYKLSYHDNAPFHRTKVKLKKEIVTMGVDNINPNKAAGTYIEPEDWNQIISDENTLLIDTRNDYEYEIGSFEKAINPNTETFREFPDYIKQHYDPKKHKKVAMFCTGGIRCEKASSYMKLTGFEEVYHLKGGILNYLEKVNKENSLWHGECFVFDDRVAVNHDLEKGQYDQCHACRYPITEHDKLSPHYIQGVSCHRCFDQSSKSQKERFAEREKQIQLAKKRGETHIGSDSKIAAEQHRQKKQQLKLSQK